MIDLGKDIMPSEKRSGEGKQNQELREVTYHTQI